MTTKTELLPCPRPFCEGPGRLMELEGFQWVECGACGLSMSAERYAPPADIAGLVAAWNARPRPFRNSFEHRPAVLLSRSVCTCWTRQS